MLAARSSIRSLASSKIREIVNASFGVDVLRFWVGEPDEPTPEFIRRAGLDSINAGETFYTHNLGIPELRAALAAYLSRLHGNVREDQISATSAGVNALMLVSQLLLDPGDRVVEVVPLWPNLQEIPKILGAHVTTVPLRFSRTGWELDLDRLLDSLTPGTRGLYINSPNNPTGWTISREAQRAVLERCRKYGIWIFSDDAYERVYFEGEGVAPSFFELAEPGERLISVNTFSKTWLMAGWRLGWIVLPAELMDDLSKLIEFNTSCAPVFVQRAGVRAVTEGEPVIRRTRERFRKARDFLVRELNAIPGVEAALPSGTMYAFFRVEGMNDSLAFCKKLVNTAKLGLAPGSAFGPEGESYVRWCFASSEERLAQGIERLRLGLKS